MPADEEAGSRFGGEAPCEAGKLLGVEECARPGRATYTGLVLCKEHLRRFELEDRREALRSLVVLLEAAMEGTEDRDLRRSLLLRRRDAAARLRITETLYRQEIHAEGHG